MFWSVSMNKWLQCACPRNMDVWFCKNFLVLRKSYLQTKITLRILQLYSHIYVRQLGSYGVIWMEMFGPRWYSCYRIAVYLIHALMTYAVQLLIYDLNMFSHHSVPYLAVILFNEFKPIAEYCKFILCFIEMPIWKGTIIALDSMLIDCLLPHSASGIWLSGVLVISFGDM